MRADTVRRTSMPPCWKKFLSSVATMALRTTAGIWARETRMRRSMA